jgi:murein DD-endopeptidase MepM/ murein hydrolase activator NlpD
MKTLMNRFVVLATALLLSACAHHSPSRNTSSVTDYDIPAEKPAEADIFLGTNDDARNSFFFDWPVDRANFSRGFMPNKRRPHLGIDLAAKKGTPVMSSHRGTVIYAGRDFRGFGNMVLIEAGNGWATIYAHLERFLVKEGQKVIQGQVIGTMGRTGRATGVHLHFEIRKDRGPVDPLLYLPQGHKVANRIE